MGHGLWIGIAALLAGQALAAAPPPPRWPGLEGGGAYVLFLSTGVTVVNGTPRDLERARTRRGASTADLFWFERGGGELIVRDAATLKQLAAVFAPQMRLAQQQAALAAQQQQITDEQARVEAQLSDLIEQQSGISERMASLAAEQARQQEEGEDTSDVEAEMQGLEESVEELGQPEADLADRRQELLGQQQGAARQQEDLARRQEQAVREAAKALNALVQQALASGAAVPESPAGKPVK
jgi:bla regulator protein blaR1